MTRIILTKEDCFCNIAEFYKNVAWKSGIDVAEDSEPTFNCTKICVTKPVMEENPEQDFLGDIYSELGLNSKEHQQIFTPYHVARMMAEISMGDLPKQIEEKGYVSIMDCCCGAGATLIGAINVAKNQLEKTDLNFQNHVLIVGQDIDRVVAMMCYIQVSLLGVAGYFKVGNALTEPMTAGDSLENYWFTPVYFFPVWQYRRIFRQMNDMVVSTDPSGGDEHGEV